MSLSPSVSVMFALDKDFEQELKMLHRKSLYQSYIINMSQLIHVPRNHMTLKTTRILKQRMLQA